MAYELSKIGAKLILSATTESKLNRVRDKCLQINRALSEDDVLVIKLDMSQLCDHEPAFEEALRHFGRVDILLNNAGRYQAALFVESNMAIDKKTFDINVFGTVNLTRVVLQHWLRDNLRGHIAVTSRFVIDRNCNRANGTFVQYHGHIACANRLDVLSDQTCTGWLLQRNQCRSGAPRHRRYDDLSWPRSNGVVSNRLYF